MLLLRTSPTSQYSCLLLHLIHSYSQCPFIESFHFQDKAEMELEREERKILQLKLVSTKCKIYMEMYHVPYLQGNNFAD